MVNFLLFFFFLKGIRLIGHTLLNQRTWRCAWRGTTAPLQKSRQHRSRRVLIVSIVSTGETILHSSCRQNVLILHNQRYWLTEKPNFYLRVRLILPESILFTICEQEIFPSCQPAHIQSVILSTQFDRGKSDCATAASIGVIDSPHYWDCSNCWHKDCWANAEGRVCRLGYAETTKI